VVWDSIPDTFRARHHWLRRSSAGGDEHIIRDRLASWPAIAPPLRASTGDPTPITPVKGMYSGEVDSLDQDLGIATLDPGMQFPGN